MNDQEYMKTRVEDQIAWFSKKSKRNRYYYNSLKVLEILLALLIPLLAGLVTAETGYYKYLIGILGFLVAAVTGIINLFKFHEKWTEYRLAAESLKQERYLYLTRTGIYNKGDLAYGRFVERIEGLLAKENRDWTGYMSDDGGEGG